ncbi:MAG: arginine--tRNA ligase [Patescibacteria group bacterium]
MKQTMFGIMGVAEVVTAAVCQAVLETFGKVIQASELKLGTPPKKEMGDVAITCHSLAKVLKKNPAQIASQLATAISAEGIFQEVKAVGAYLNFVLAPGPVVQTVVSQIRQQGKTYGQCSTGQGKRVMIEYGGPNTNKALHIGHLRNHQIGIALINILNAVGYQVIPVGIINDRGIMICQSMVGYMLWGEGKTPQSTGIKGDHFVGKYYAQYRAAVTAELEVWLQGQGIELEQYNALLDSDDQQGKELKKKFEAQSKLVQQAYDLLRQWEAGDSETRQLWATMNEWVISAFQPTYQRQGVHFQRVWLESETYKCGKETILAQLEKGVVAYGTQGNIFIDLNDVDLKEPTLLRSDGTTVYLTQDIATAEQRFTEYAPLDQLIYVVACEQQYHFRALFETLKRFGFEWAQKCYHLSYGMVKMAGGKVSSRKIKKGGVFLADDLMDHLHELARQAILERDSEASGPELEHRAELIGLAALTY